MLNVYINPRKPKKYSQIKGKYALNVFNDVRPDYIACLKLRVQIDDAIEAEHVFTKLMVMR